jgi:hypothetical protein
MVTILLTITVVSLILTIALAALVVKLTRDEKRRSAARVAALGQMADAVAERDFAIVDARDLGDDLSFGRDDQGYAPASDLFAAHGGHEALGAQNVWPQRLGVLVAVALVVLVTTVAIRSRAGVRSTTPDTTAATAAATQAPGLLELISLKHSQEGDTLTITGLVQNPRDGVPLAKVAATAFLFGTDGAFVASGRAPLDFTLLKPGEESSFMIAVPVTAAVARYRVGFRGEDGRIIGHVDRRGNSTIATATQPHAARGRS